ncbi:ATP-dependent Clp protease ATP-binding subunit ClpC [Tamaricihabitans halophyticus]|uniref:ATP-dependent Clp protease ATP-binding subunit ClpC n=1 Tax=Tamaricihabitans halophyticus TaxID=1262583 RepID=A0A4R2R0K3_9PSEU|nr:Clp protease N-terminal domain-containing protein [Tamaricihabitans halophyticus]TCP56160.1 ATP-dependent Clp protease ATP-binding subunit ClpC [Tamaricihabitans halophyticus]
MPKINVYLPDELADTVKEIGLPVSAICQRALATSARRVTAIRAATLGDLASDNPTAQLSQFTERAKNALELAIERARADRTTEVHSAQLLLAILTEGQNLALHVLRAEEINPDQLATILSERGSTGTAEPAGTRFSATTANALELAVTEALSLGHNYVGCEHLLLGLLSEPDGLAGKALRELGTEVRGTRRAIVAALSGHEHLRANLGKGSPGELLAATLREQLRPLLARLDRLEEHVGIDAAGAGSSGAGS